MSITIALIGATGNVGRNVASQLLQRHLVDPSQLSLFSSPRSQGRVLTFDSYEITVESIENIDFYRYNLCVFNTNEDISELYIPRALEAGCYVVDSSSRYRLDPEVPLIVPPVNGHDINRSQSKIYAHANCLVSPIATVVAPLHTHHPISRIHAATYQSTSGAGKRSCDECWDETKAVIDNSPFQRKHFSRQIAFNIIPQVGTMHEGGETSEEFKIIHEVKKAVDPNLRIAATAVRVPVMIGHSIALSIEFQHPTSLEDVATILGSAPSVTYLGADYITPVEVVGSDDVWVCRARKDPSLDHGIHLWLCSDNLRRGAATDCVEIVEHLLSSRFPG